MEAKPRPKSSSRAASPACDNEFCRSTTSSSTVVHDNSNTGRKRLILISTIRNHGPDFHHTVCSVLRQEEDRHCRRTLQAGQRPDQGQRKASCACSARDPAIQGLRAGTHSRNRQVRYVWVDVRCIGDGQFPGQDWIEQDPSPGKPLAIVLRQVNDRD